MYSLMDGFSSYNQIKIAPEDQQKIAFTCAWGTFYWNVMPFGLKNVGTMYQGAVTKIFHNMMHQTMEDYVNETHVKITKCNSHLQDFGPILARIEKFSLRFSPKKCAFGVTSGKLLGYIVSTKGIEVSLEKFQEIMDMPPPHNISQMRGFQERLQSIHKLISQLENKSQPFTKTLHKGVKYNQSKDYDQILTQIKQYLTNPLILMPPIYGKPLILYILVAKSSLGIFLAQEDNDNKERAIRI